MSRRGQRVEQPSPEALSRFCGPRCRGGPRCGGCVERARRERIAADEREREAQRRAEALDAEARRAATLDHERLARACEPPAVLP